MSTDAGVSQLRLPTYSTRFIGRETEIGLVHGLLRRDGVETEGLEVPGASPRRLVTVSGVGGCGKTRLAVEVGRSFSEVGDDNSPEFRDGVRWVPLAPVTDAGDLPRAVADALDLRAAAAFSSLDVLVSELRDRDLLLVLDNCEHLVAVCRRVISALLRACPRVSVLATSRTPLQLAEETVFAVPPLRLAGPQRGRSGADLGESEATRLFLDRAAMVTPACTSTRSTVGTIAEICRRLEGLPLAIELAASWMRVITARDLLREIERSIAFLSCSAQGIPERHQSMRAVLDSSWQWLGVADQQVFSALAVFRGDFSRDAAEVVGQATLSSLSALAEKSLISRLPDSECETRYHIHELVRQYALERLEALDAGQLQAARQRHLDYFVALVERAEECWDTSHEAEWLDRLRTDQANVSAALSWALDCAHTEAALRLSGGLLTFWLYSSPLGQFRPVLDRALSLTWDSNSRAAMRGRAKVLNVAGYAAVAASDFGTARARFDEGLRLYRLLGDDGLVAWSLRGRSYANRLAGDLAASQADEERSLAITRAISDPRGEAWSIHDLGEIAFARGDLDRAEQLLEEGLGRFEEHGVAFGAYRAIALLGDIARRREQWLAAITRYEEALIRQRHVHFVARGADIIEGLAGIAVALHRPASGARLLGAGDAWRATFGFARYIFHEQDHEKALKAAERQLTAQAWSANYEAGRELTAEQAMDLAHSCAQQLASLSRGRHADRLTQRELEVLHSVALGMSSSEIAAQLVVSPRTVHAHLRSIYDKLNVSTRTAAAIEAARLNLV